MTPYELRTAAHPPSGAHPLLKALWHDAKGEWAKAHQLAQDDDTSNGSWVHAYLHRKEGDLSNASYWYHRARKSLPEISLDEEWNQIAASLLGA
ncbi:MAG: hypothetical protein JST14_10195 [Bacteroidetes bacterium]|nr:hypothetical protein [Bacteroidota bacterium]MBS1978714.1 hypothetical protein [Bacteroidota bacterium]